MASVRWYLETGLKEFGLSKESLLFAYFVAAASIFEPERSPERLAWAKTAALLETLKSYKKDQERRNVFMDRLSNIYKPDYSKKYASHCLSSQAPLCKIVYLSCTKFFA